MLLPNALLPLQPRLPPRYASAAATAVEAIFGGDGSAYAAAVQLVGRALGTTAPRLGEPPPASAALLLPRAAAALDASAARRCGCHCDAGDSSGEVCDCQRDVGSSWPSTLSSSSSKPALCRWDGSACAQTQSGAKHDGRVSQGRVERRKRQGTAGAQASVRLRSSEEV